MIQAHRSSSLVHVFSQHLADIFTNKIANLNVLWRDHTNTSGIALFQSHLWHFAVLNRPVRTPIATWTIAFDALGSCLQRNYLSTTHPHHPDTHLTARLMHPSPHSILGTQSHIGTSSCQSNPSLCIVATPHAFTPLWSHVSCAQQSHSSPAIQTPWRQLLHTAWSVDTRWIEHRLPFPDTIMQHQYFNILTTTRQHFVPVRPTTHILHWSGPKCMLKWEPGTMRDVMSMLKSMLKPHWDTIANHRFLQLSPGLRTSKTHNPLFNINTIITVSKAYIDDAIFMVSASLAYQLHYLSNCALDTHSHFTHIKMKPNMSVPLNPSDNPNTPTHMTFNVVLEHALSQ